MTDELVMGLWRDRDLRVVVTTATGVARNARDSHKAGLAASELLAEALVASALLSALQLQKQKQDATINLQLECGGPLRGLFVESTGDGGLRGYVKNPLVDIESRGEYRWRPALGNSGYLSVLRDQGNGEFFRSSVELEAFDLPRDFERYFQSSEQVETGVAIEIVPLDGEPLGAVGGVLLQALPGGDVQALRAARDRIVGGELREALASLGDGGAGALLSKLFDEPSLELTARYPLRWRCPCSKERVMRSLATLGTDELKDIVEKDGKATAHCQFCSTEYVVNKDELEELIAQLQRG